MTSHLANILVLVLKANFDIPSIVLLFAESSISYNPLGPVVIFVKILYPLESERLLQPKLVQNTYAVNTGINYSHGH